MKKQHTLKFLISSILCPFLASGQEWIQFEQKEFNHVISSVSIDTEDNTYIGFENGSLQKFSNKGVELLVFSLPNQSAITLVEAQNNRKIFLFYKDIQQITILDRFSATPKHYLLRDFDIYFASSACPTPDGSSIWVVENNPQRLRKIDLLQKTVIHEVQHTLGDSINFMRTYQNLLLVANENGMHILDQFGNLTLSVKLGNTKYLQIWESQIIATSNNGFITIDPYQEKIMEFSETVFRNKKTILKLNNEYVVIGPRSLIFYTLTQHKKN